MKVQYIAALSAAIDLDFEGHELDFDFDDATEL